MKATEIPRDRQLRVAFLDEALAPASPLVTWATSLERQGVQTHVDNLQLTASRIQWLRFMTRWDVVVLQLYKTFSEHFVKMMAYTLLLGRPVIRKWSGTDVLRCASDSAVRQRCLALARVTTQNVTESPHLAEELLDLGIHCLVAPPVLGSLDIQQRARETKLPRTCLVYLPDARLAFYGYATVEAAIEACPEISFVIVGDETHSLARHENVKSLGWVADMVPLWPEIGALLRVTEHDGTPRMVTEALARGKQVFYSWPMDGATLVKSPCTAIRALKEFAVDPKINEAGITAGIQLYNPQNLVSLHERLESLARSEQFVRSLSGFRALLF